MKKSITLLVLILSLHSLMVTAQTEATNYIGIKGGISIPNLTAGGSKDNPVSTGYSSRLGPDFSAFYEANLSNHFSLTTQIEYSAQGGKKNGFQAFPFPQEYALFFTQQGQTPPAYLYADFKNEAKINYIMLSELAKVNFPLGLNSPLSIYIEAGPFGGLLVSAKDVRSGSSDIYADDKKQRNLTAEVGAGAQSFDSTDNVKSDLHKGNFGIEGDVGVAFHFTNSKIFLEGGGNYGFLNIQKGSENGKNNIGAAVIRIGYAYSFN